MRNAGAAFVRHAGVECKQVLTTILWAQQAIYYFTSQRHRYFVIPVSWTVVVDLKSFEHLQKLTLSLTKCRSEKNVLSLKISFSHSLNLVVAFASLTCLIACKRLVSIYNLQVSCTRLLNYTIGTSLATMDRGLFLSDMTSFLARERVIFFESGRIQIWCIYFSGHFWRRCFPMNLYIGIFVVIVVLAVGSARSVWVVVVIHAIALVSVSLWGNIPLRLE